MSPAPETIMTAVGLILLVMVILVIRVKLVTDAMNASIRMIISDTHARVEITDHLRPVRIDYGWWHLPCTMTSHPTRMHVSAPVGRVPHIRTEEDANRIGQQLRDSYGFDTVEAYVQYGVRHWNLIR